MKSSWQTPARDFTPGMGRAVADRTIARPLIGGERENWADVAFRVALGNSSLNAEDAPFEFEAMHHHLRQASILMSGRHLQHGDSEQSSRNQEVFSNCATSASSFIEFYLLLNGSGVGRAYDDDMMIVDWANKMPTLRCFIRPNHPDVLSGEIAAEYTERADWGNGTHGQEIYYTVPDSREGWAKAIEQIERLTWEGTHADKLLTLDFSDVRHRGSPIAGMQNRPASGPGPLMDAVKGIASVKGKEFDAWEATLHVDHYLAECVLVGGARRAARMAMKTWRDKTTLKFVSIKKGGVLWSSNNSVAVDEEFWRLVRATDADLAYESAEIVELAAWAKTLFEAICQASYHDGTGEPGLINVDKLTQKDEGVEVLFDGNYAESARMKLDTGTLAMTAELAKAFAAKRYNMVTNPCGEIPLSILGGYCNIGDVVPFHAASDNDAEEAFRVTTRALIRVNTMNCLYRKEVDRTNRIGVGITGVHEYAWARFGYGWKDLVNEDASLPFWNMLARFSNAVHHESISYSERLGVAVPHTNNCFKPAGTTSKLFGLTEGAHLPSMREFLRWVQFRSDDPLIEQYRAKGYPVRELTTYKGTAIVGFPTAPEICNLGMGDKLVTAAEATPEEQYQWLRLLEKYWLSGNGQHDASGQLSYTLKYLPDVVGYEEFRSTLLNGQSTIKCCSVMPQSDTSAYEYLPEQPVSAGEFKAIVAGITDSSIKEGVDFAHIDCGTGGCPIDFNEDEEKQAA